MKLKTAADEDLIARWIEANPHKPGPADVRIRGHAVSVWAIVGQIAVELDKGESPHIWQKLAQVTSEPLIQAVAHYYRLPPEAVSAALAYYRLHPEPLIARVSLNQSGPDG